MTNTYKQYKTLCDFEVARLVIDDIKSGLFAKIHIDGFEDTIFFASDFNDTLNCINNSLGGTFSRDDLTIDRLENHFENMIADGATITTYSPFDIA